VRIDDVGGNGHRLRGGKKRKMEREDRIDEG
jgi:hypothetical protein